MKQVLGCCKLYISESRNKAALERIERAAKAFPEVVITNKFEDSAYNRVGYTVVSSVSNPSPFKRAVYSMVETAFQSIDFGSHSGSHPRLGVVDHVCFHPLGGSSMSHVASVAQSLAHDVGSHLGVPAFLYGAAHAQGRKLDSVRRELGYFQPNSGTQWVGEPVMNALQPDHGPPSVAAGKGVIVIGATNWVDNYNVPIHSTDVRKARLIARRVSERGGGLRFVQAMALSRSSGITEIACNLLAPSDVGGQDVQNEVERLAAENDLSFGKGYFTDMSHDELLQSYSKHCLRIDVFDNNE